ncbi:MAG TPA: type II toxin-antitoxin system HigB family toxin [Tepidisphaeraceae bacterium]|jgi:mRNA interferase HigB|nr:type II toxin-antitoxin system HigB family toxin [Tepidisphaeraceae bacterium]
MRVLSRKTLRRFWEQPGHKDAEQPLKAWFREALKAKWTNSAQVKAAYRSASIVANSRVVFNIAGNEYRLVVRINYAYGIVYIRFIGTHKQYDQIDVTEV